jgi:hypothetical protein
MNILNKAYFPARQLIDGTQVTFHSPKPQGQWIVGCIHEKYATNHVTFFRQREKRWTFLERIGNGAEIGKLVTGDAGVPGNHDR